VWANFLDPDGVWSIWQSGRGGTLRLCAALMPQLKGVGPGGEVVDTTLDAGSRLAGSAWRQRLVHHPATGETIAPPATGGAAASLPPLEQRKPLDFRIVDLVDFHNPLTEWQPPSSIDPAAFDEYRRKKSAAASSLARSSTFLSLRRRLKTTRWLSWKQSCAWGKLSGLVLANEFVAAARSARCPIPGRGTAFAGLDRGAMIDLTVENATAVMEAIAKGKPHCSSSCARTT